MTAALQEQRIDAALPEAEAEAEPDDRPFATRSARIASPPIDVAMPGYRQRIDGWSPERQRGFLERIAEGATVDEATASVGLSPRAAYSLRRRASGAAFALGWDAAKLVARPIVAEALFCRAMVGQIERLTKPDGDVIERHRYDNRLAMSLLARLDRHAEESETTSAAARLIATEFDAFLDLVERDAGPARAGLFLGERVRSTDAADGMAPIVALARADRWLRSAAGLASEIDVTDLDPAARADWTAGQWARAEAAGLLSLAPEPVPKFAPKSEPPKPAPKPAPASALPALPAVKPDGSNGECPVWWDESNLSWRTRFPPPSDYDGVEDGDFGDAGYSRECSEEEGDILEAPRDREIAERHVVEGADRDSWFSDYAEFGGIAVDDADNADDADDANDADDADDVDDADDGGDAVAATDAACAAPACTVDPGRPVAPEPDPMPDDGAATDPGQSHVPAAPASASANAAPKSATGRSPATHSLDGDPP